MKLALPVNWQKYLSNKIDEEKFNQTLYYFDQLMIENENNIFPPRSQVFNAFHQINPRDVKVVILGQDPYPTRGHANGLAFSVHPEIKPLPKSLQNIFKELTFEFGVYSPKNNGDLTHWSKQGVLLLNTVLTVEEGKPGSHFHLGWENFTDKVIEKLSEEKGMIFVLWGKHAAKKEAIIHPESIVLKTAHPSPLSAYRGFFNSNLFIKINDLLETQNKVPITW